MKLKPDTSITRLRRRLGTSPSSALRQSSKRQQYLEKVARMISKENVRVHLVESRAAARPADDDGDHDMDILIPTEEYDQPLTGIPPKPWHLLVQETLLFHELGHVHYTDFSRM